MNKSRCNLQGWPCAFCLYHRVLTTSRFYTRLGWHSWEPRVQMYVCGEMSNIQTITAKQTHIDESHRKEEAIAEDKPGKVWWHRPVPAYERQRQYEVSLTYIVKSYLRKTNSLEQPEARKDSRSQPKYLQEKCGLPTSDEEIHFFAVLANKCVLICGGSPKT